MSMTRAAQIRTQPVFAPLTTVSMLLLGSGDALEGADGVFRRRCRPCFADVTVERTVFRGRDVPTVRA
jgi:hypothetical protein